MGTWVGLPQAGIGNPLPGGLDEGEGSPVALRCFDPAHPLLEQFERWVLGIVDIEEPLGGLQALCFRVAHG